MMNAMIPLPISLFLTKAKLNPFIMEEGRRF